jgi:hypothetical protein
MHNLARSRDELFNTSRLYKQATHWLRKTKITEFGRARIRIYTIQIVSRLGLILTNEVHDNDGYQNLELELVLHYKATSSLCGRAVRGMASCSESVSAPHEHHTGHRIPLLAQLMSQDVQLMKTCNDRLVTIKIK